jgi:hypothetical protein
VRLPGPAPRGAARRDRGGTRPMKGFFQDKEHLVRMAGLFLAGLLAFVLMRVLLVPKDFGVYGHYRAGAIKDNRARPLQYAGRKACVECHTEVVDARKGSKHEKVACESCHGPLAKHAADPTAEKPALPDVKTVCMVCHTENAAKPSKFPQVNPKDHGDGQPCKTCHKPHHPEVS